MVGVIPINSEETPRQRMAGGLGIPQSATRIPQQQIIKVVVRTRWIMYKFLTEKGECPGADLCYK